jgi:hypothetical protein
MAVGARQRLRAEREAGRWRRVAVAGSCCGIVAGLVFGVVAGRFSETVTDPPPAQVTTTNAPPTACRDALRLASASLAHAIRINRAMSDQTKVLDALFAGTITAEQAGEKIRLTMQDGAAQSAMFEQSQADYVAVVNRCST